MSAMNEGVLEKGYWQPAKPSPPTTPTIDRARKWITDLVRPSTPNKSPGGKETPMRRTAWLDGLRGFAAFLVYWGHHQTWSHESIHAELILENSWGYEGRHYFVQLPFIRTFFSGGHYSVACFFLISGYVLSAKPLSLIQSGDYMKLTDNLASALFRRWLRLFLPVIATTFLYICFFRTVWKGAVPEPKGNWRDEIWLWYCEFKNFSFVFRTGGEPWLTYNFHAWSIPVEFRGSIAVYTALLAVSRCTRNARLWVEVGLIVYFMWIVDAWYCAAFITGMLLCDLDMLAADDNLPNFVKRLEPWKKQAFCGMFALGVLLGGCPAQSGDIDVLRRSPGWKYFAWMKPQAVWDYKWFFLYWAGTFTVASAPRIQPLKSFFETRFCQYLGRISFALYLVHGPVLWTLGERLYAATGFTRESNVYTCPEWINIWPLSRRGPLGMELAFIAPQMILLPVTFWLAEMVTRLIDEPSVKFANWLYSRTMAPAIKL